MIPYNYLLRTIRFYSRPFALLRASEMAKYRQLRFAKRREEWLVGRLAIKELLRNLCREKGIELAWRDIEICSEPGGRPYAKIWRDGRCEKFPGVSISHCQRVIFCSVVGDSCEIGVDIERISPRPKLFGETFFRDDEREQFAQCQAPDDALTLAWALKEAVLKVLGTGLSEDTRNIEVTLPRFPYKTWQQAKIEIKKGDAVKVSAWGRCLGRYALAWATTKNFANKGSL